MKLLFILLQALLFPLDIDNLDIYCNPEESSFCCISIRVDNSKVLMENAILYEIVYWENFAPMYKSYALFLADALSFGLSYNENNQTYCICTSKVIRRKVMPINKVWKYLIQDENGDWRIKQHVSNNRENKIYESLFYNGYYIYRNCYKGGYDISKTLKYMP